MFPSTRTATIKLLTLSLLMSLSACATLNNDSDKAVYYESALSDKNRAPASFTPPPTPSTDESSTLDPFYMRTQADYYFSMGEAYSLEGNATKAIESFKMVLIYDPVSPTVNMRLATEYLKQGMVSESVTQAEEAVKKDAKSVDARLLLGGLYSSLKLFPKAMDQYQAVLKLDANNTEAPLYIGALYSEQKENDKAVSYFQSLIKNQAYETPYLAYYYIGRVRVEQTDTKHQKMAEEAFKKALQIKPDFADAVLALGAFYTKNKQEAKALTMYKNFQSENTPSPKIAEVLAQIYIEKEDYGRALEQLEVLESNADDPLNVKMKIALILIEQKNYDLATAKLEEILRDAPESDKIRFYLAAVYEETHQNEKAIEEFKKIPVGSTYFGESVVHTAYLLKNANKMEEALNVASKGLADRKDQPQIYAIYASLLDEKDQPKEAAAILKQGLDKFPDNTQLTFYYGTVNDRLGNKELVVTEMKKVLELDPNHVQGLNYLAFTYAEEGVNLIDAEKLARHALELEPQDGYVLDTLGWVLFKQNKVTESIKILEAAQQYQSTVSIIAEHLGDAYYKQAMVDKAKKMYKKAVDLETDKKKIDEIRQKITSIEKQQLENPRMPASLDTEAP